MTTGPLRVLRAHRPEGAVLPVFALVTTPVLVLLDHGHTVAPAGAPVPPR